MPSARPHNGVARSCSDDNYTCAASRAEPRAFIACAKRLTALGLVWLTVIGVCG